jgi:DNA-binding CsgD family transcriptional regulator
VSSPRGEAGIGKTELLRRIVHDASDAGVSVLRGQGDPLERTRPFGVIAAALDLRPGSADPNRARAGRAILGEAPGGGAVPGSAGARFLVIDQVLELLDHACRDGPVVLALEDVHWADDATMSALDAVMTWLRHVPLRQWDRDAERGVAYYHRFLAPPLVRLAVFLGRRDLAARVVAALREGAELAPEVPTVQSCAWRCRGLLDGDPALLLRAVDSSRRGGRVHDHALTCEDAASLLLQAGEPDHAKQLLREAQGVHDRLGASRAALRVAAQLRRLGVRRGARGPRQQERQGWAGLTASETAVADLVAAGLTNGEVARRLHLSPHTVNTHLRHVFQKLSVSNRTELAAQAARR